MDPTPVLPNLMSWQTATVAGVLLALSPLFMFFGQKIFNYLLAIAATLGSAFVTSVVISKTDNELPQYAIDLIVGACGLFVGCFALMFETVGIFALGVLSGGTVSNLVFQMATVTNDKIENLEWLHISVVSVGAAILGLVMALVKHDLKRVTTAFVGSYLFISSSNYFLYFVGQKVKQPNFLPDEPQFWPSTFFKSGFSCTDVLCYVLMGVWAFAFLVAVVVQTKLHAAEKKDRRGEREPLLQYRVEEGLRGA